MGLEVAKDPSLSIGFSSSVSFPGAQLIDKTTKATGRSEHTFRANNASSSAAKNNAVFEVGSLAECEFGCLASPSPGQESTVLEIDVGLKWGLDSPLMNWAHVESDEKSFSYTTWC